MNLSLGTLLHLYTFLDGLMHLFVFLVSCTESISLLHKSKVSVVSNQMSIINRNSISYLYGAQNQSAYDASQILKFKFFSILS